jgi:hypothetical protein
LWKSIHEHGVYILVICRSVVSRLVEGLVYDCQDLVKKLCCHYCGKLFNEHGVYILVKNPNILQIDGKSISGWAGGDYLDLLKKR